MEGSQEVITSVDQLSDDDIVAVKIAMQTDKNLDIPTAVLVTAEKTVAVHDIAAFQDSFQQRVLSIMEANSLVDLF